MHVVNHYYENILRPYLNPENTHLLIDTTIAGADGISLEATELSTDSSTGIVIIPGITVPREACFRLLAHFREYNVLTYDLRGQALSEGALDWNLCVADINAVGQDFKKRRNLKQLIGIGYSFGGLTLLRSSLESVHPYDLRITLAAPLEMKAIVGKMPEQMTSLLVYVHNFVKALSNPAFRDEIVKSHQSYRIDKFLRNPRVVALRVDRPGAFNRMREQAQKMVDFFQNIALPTHMFYPGADQRLGPIAGNAYDEIRHLAAQRGIGMQVMAGLTHRFNTMPEKKFMISCNNELLLNQLDAVIRHHKDSTGARRKLHPEGLLHATDQ